MDLQEAILSRRSIRAFRPDPVPAAMLEDILELARWIPSFANTQCPAATDRPCRVQGAGDIRLGQGSSGGLEARRSRLLRRAARHYYLCRQVPPGVGDV